MKKQELLISILMAVIMTGCLKNLFDKEEKLPPASQTGNQTIGCKIEGKVWVPNGTHEIYGASIPALSANLYKDHRRNYFLTLSARKDPSLFNSEDDSYDDLNLDVMLPFSSIETLINKTCFACGIYCPYSSIRFKIRGLFYGGCYMTDSLHTGRVLFTRIDTLNKIFSGTFEFSALDKNTGKTINVTDGRFDVQTR